MACRLLILLAPPAEPTDWVGRQVNTHIHAYSGAEARGEKEERKRKRSTAKSSLSWMEFIRMKGRDKPSPAKTSRKTSKETSSSSDVKSSKNTFMRSLSRDTTKRKTTTTTKKRKQENVFLQIYGLSSSTTTSTKSTSSKVNKRRSDPSTKNTSSKVNKRRSDTSTSKNKETVSPVQSPSLKRRRRRSPSPKLTPPDISDDDIDIVESVFESALQKEKSRQRSQRSSQRSFVIDRTASTKITTTTTTTKTKKKKKKKKKKHFFTSSSSSASDQDNESDDSIDEDDNVRPSLPRKYLRRSIRNTKPLQLTSKVPPRTAFVPKSIHTYLAKYQIEGIQWLFDHYAKGQGAILGDDMGLGKTVQTISFIAAILQKTGERDQDVPQLRKRRRGEDNSKRILIVMPSSVLDNWYAI